MAIQKMYTVDKFLGLNEAADGYSELKLGQASRMINFTVTDGGNLTVRPGFSGIPVFADTDKLLDVWAGYIRNDEYLIVTDLSGDADRITVLQKKNSETTILFRDTGHLQLTGAENAVIKTFPFGDRVYIMGPCGCVSLQMNASGVRLTDEQPYVPLVITGAAPLGGGTKLENANLLTSLRRICYSCDGQSTDYVLPSEAVAVLSAVTDEGEQDIVFNSQNHTITFTTPPAEGVHNLTVTYDSGQDHSAQVTNMPRWEAYNGATDTRLFFYGDGSHITLYTGVDENGKPTPLYVPAMNEIAVDFSGSPITGMIRHYNKLMVFKPDGASTITYEPVTLPGGEVIAGFYLRTVNKAVGHDSFAQVQLVNNYPRTVSAKALYEWRVSSSYYNDERYAKRISDPVAGSLASADPARVVSCDDTATHTYYLFLNDDRGTILVNRYNLDVWTTYRSPLATGVKSAFICDDCLHFRTDDAIYWLDPSARYDTDGKNIHSIPAVWESGYMAFGEDYRRKFTSLLWFAIKPESYSAVTITAASDRKSTYAEKTIRSELFDYGKISYAKWGYDASSAIRTRRIKLKVKKAIFYKLIIKVTEPGAKATVLGFDQLIRFTSLVK